MDQNITRPSVSSLGIVPFRNARELEEEEKAKRSKENSALSPFVSSLSGYIDTCWSDAKEAKTEIERGLAMGLRQRSGEYEADKLAAIKEMGGSEVYVLLTSTKCRAAESWMSDIYRAIENRPFAFDPTPLADLPLEIEQRIKTETFELAQEVLSQASMAGEMVDDVMLIQKIKEYALKQKDKELDEIKKKARKRADRMEDKVADQLAEGGWTKALNQVISDFCTFKAAVLKGPVFRSRKVQKWGVDEAGKSAIQIEEQIVPEFDRVSPFDVYPAPDSRDPDDGYLLERHRITRQELQALIGVPGYSEENIRAVLRDHPHGLYRHESIDTDREMIEFHGKSLSSQKGEKLEALEFWGAVSGKMLKEWGLDEELDEDLDYEVNAWKIGTHVIRAVLNPDPLGRKPYFVDSYERLTGSFWGKGIPDLMRDVQDICNAVARAIVNNAALASGPQVEVNVDRAGDQEGIYPWKIWQADNQQMSDSPAVRFYQPQIVVNELLRVFEFFNTMSEDQTGVPRWAHGNANLGGAASTSSGLSMLMDHASKGIRESISHIDRMISDCVERVYDYNMMYDEDESLKGDCRIVAKGSSALVAKEQQVIRIREMLQATNNPTDIQIMGLEGRAKLLEAATKDLLEGDTVIPDERKLMEVIAEMKEREQMMLMQGMGAGPKGAAPPGGEQTLDAAGQPAGGTDAALFQQQAV